MIGFMRDYIYSDVMIFLFYVIINVCLLGVCLGFAWGLLGVCLGSVARGDNKYIIVFIQI